MKNIFINEAQYKMLKESVFFEKQTKGVFSNEESSLSPIISQKHEEKIIKAAYSYEQNSNFRENKPTFKGGNS